jgi:hypothetical protein
MVAFKKYRHFALVLFFILAFWVAWFLGRGSVPSSLPAVPAVPAGKITINGIQTTSQQEATKAVLTKANLVPREAKYWKILVE